MGGSQSTPELQLNEQCSLDAGAAKCSSELICSDYFRMCKFPSGTDISAKGYTTMNEGPFPTELNSGVCNNGLINANSKTELICAMTNVNNKFKYGLKNIDSMTNVDSKFNYSKKNLDQKTNIPGSIESNKAKFGTFTLATNTKVTPEGSS
jgi:hypothetical protein